MNAEEAFYSSPQKAIKHKNYFPIYDEIFAKYKNTPITFVEVGVLHGGSLFMWRNFFGESARIIGIDLNPAALKWNNFNFEIYIGNQGDPNFWLNFYSAVGPIDVLLDDGGHTNKHQIITSLSSVSNINDGGLLVIEDTHTSFFKDFGNPSRYSFLEFTKFQIQALYNSDNRISTVGALKNKIRKISYFDGIVAFSIEKYQQFGSENISNFGETDNATDYRNFSLKPIIRVINTLVYYMENTPILGKSTLIFSYFNPFLHRKPLNIPFRVGILVLIPILNALKLGILHIEDRKLRKYW